jgi:hypothetical protein
LVDPIDKRLEVYALDAKTRCWREVRIHQGGTTVRAEPLDAIELDLAALWSPPRITSAASQRATACRPAADPGSSARQSR